MQKRWCSWFLFFLTNRQKLKMRRSVLRRAKGDTSRRKPKDRCICSHWLSSDVTSWPHMLTGELPWGETYPPRSHLAKYNWVVINVVWRVHRALLYSSSLWLEGHHPAESGSGNPQLHLKSIILSHPSLMSPDVLLVWGLTYRLNHTSPQWVLKSAVANLNQLLNYFTAEYTSLEAPS